MSRFVLPDLGEGLQEAEIVSWHVAEGDHVVADQPLLAVETEKAVVEIPSPHAGHVRKLLAKEGERIRVGAPVLEFEEGPHAESGTVVGELAQPEPASRQAPAKPPAGTLTASPRGIRASPAVRARARECAVDLASVTPSGPDATITLADVEAAAARMGATAPATPLRGARRTMAANMARAWREVVHATVQDQADIEAWPADAPFMVRIVRALIAGCTAEPSLNASLDAATASLRANPTIDIGIAVDSPDGLFVPVLRDAARMTPDAWERQVEAFKRGVQDRSLAPADMRGATITVSNFGAIAGRHAALIVMPPQVAILGVGRAVMQAVGQGDRVTLHRALPLSLTFDHRAITGGMAARFLRAVMTDLEAAT